ncbi:MULTISPECIES: phage tail assembly chaperone [Pseudomonas]|uniref:Phage tail assembly chaperone n=1 Tax=Pseudomonas aphyarum TaxID=2942629 RepID=A0ABT5PVQ9_9PSED|nr:phage tail assembly chaperone [Pseudomonas aphyarum]MDD0967259.1 phage tail assembly chaperone [Pseudomonas aphyarum]MDD1127990.1 phage tail assembly chaperone [Pseudomonas aphyarum]
MARYARIENGVAVEVIDTGDYAIEQLFAPEFVAAMVQVPDGVSVEIGAPMADATPAIEPSRELQSPVVVQASTVEEKEPLAQERAWRQSVLAATEWLVTRHRDEQELGRGTKLKAQQYLELLEYRQTLRDWPAASSSQTFAERPAQPAWFTAVTA